MKIHTFKFLSYLIKSQTNGSDYMTFYLEGGDYAHLNERLLQIVYAQVNQIIRMRNSIKMQRNQEC